MRNAICTLAVSILAVAAFAIRAGSPPGTSPGFDEMRNLLGTWESKSPEGVTTTSAVRLVSNGTAIEETFQSSEENQMVTLYSPDGDRVAMVHICSMGNQPRMETKATTAGEKELAFGFTGITNLSSPAEGHMTHLVIRIIDKDHFDETWTFLASGKPQDHNFHFTRKS